MVDTKKTKSFNSTMVGTPVLSGTAGALIAILDAVLVTGFGSQTASTVVITDGIAVATFPTTHAAQVGTVVLMAGATPAGLNGEQRATAVTANTVSFATTEANGTATGTITVKVAPAGWTKQFTGTNLSVYKMGSVEGTGCVLRVDDTGTTVARVRGYEVMTDVSNGTGLFPSAAQWAAPGLWWSKSDTASAAARPWRIVADDRGFFYFPKNGGVSSEHQGNYFGDILSLKSNDPYSCVLRANTADRSASFGGVPDDLSYSDAAMSYGGLYAARAANTLGGAVQVWSAPVLSIGLSATHVTGAVGWAYPSPTDNGLMLTPVAVVNMVGCRGYFPGLRYSPQLTNTHFSTGDVISGSGDMAGKQVVVVKLGAATATSAQAVVFVDQTSDWR